MVYAFNWYNVGALLPLIGATFAANTAQLNVVLAAFLVGVGIFQVPAGFLDLRWGSRRTALAGLVLMGAASTASALSPTLLDLAVLRFLAGVGAAFFFSPALSLVASYFPAGQRGPIIGLYNGGFSLGGAIGVTAGAAIGLRFGWPFALGVGGVALLGMVAFNWWVLPNPLARAAAAGVAQRWAVARQVLRSRSIWALSLGLAGFWAAVYVVAQDYVKFAHVAHGAWGIQTAANLATIFIVASFPGGLLGGWIAERGGDRRIFLAVFGVADGVLIGAIPVFGLYATAGVFAVAGLFDGVVFAVLYLVPSYLPESRGAGLALAIAVVNSIQVLLGSIFAVVFGLVAFHAGFSDAWLLTGAFTIALIPLVLLVSPNRGGSAIPAPGPAAGALTPK